MEDIKEKEEVLDENVENKEEVVEKTKEELLTEENEKLKKEVLDWKKEYSIKLADFENYKKRIDREFTEYKKYACEGVIIKKVENLDILSMAIESAKSSKDIEALLEGLEMLKNKMITYLDEEGLKEIEAEGLKYDPYMHHAVSTEQNEEKENDEIVKVLQKGYKLKGKVIRPAMVVINKK